MLTETYSVRQEKQALFIKKFEITIFPEVKQ